MRKYTDISYIDVANILLRPFAGNGLANSGEILGDMTPDNFGDKVTKSAVLFGSALKREIGIEGFVMAAYHCLHVLDGDKDAANQRSIVDAGLSKEIRIPNRTGEDHFLSGQLGSIILCAIHSKVNAAKKAGSWPSGRSVKSSGSVRKLGLGAGR